MGENNTTLLMNVLKIHYKDRRHVLDEALQVIKEYSSKTTSDQSEYDTISEALKNMLGDLPTEILNYFITLIPPPKNQKHLETTKEDTTNIRHVLLNYLNNVAPVPSDSCDVDSKHSTAEVIAESKESFSKTESELMKKPVGRIRRRCYQRSPPDHLVDTVSSSISRGRRGEAVPIKYWVDKLAMTLRFHILRANPLKHILPNNFSECKKLLDICAEFLVRNKSALTSNYHKLKEKAWHMLYSNRYSGTDLENLYDVIRDLNKKIKWLRLLDSEVLSAELIKENYGKSKVFVMERNVDKVAGEDPFKLSEGLRIAISDYINA